MNRLAIPLAALLALSLGCGNELPATPEAPVDDEILTPIEEEEPAPLPELEKPTGDCGNGALDDEEVCDSAAPEGLTCRHLGFAGGELGCAETCDALADASCAPLTPAPIAPLGQSIFDEGSFEDDDPTWARPSAACEGASEGRRFDAFAYINNTGSAQRVVVTAAWGEGNDGFLHAFAYGSDLRFADGCQQGNDDFEGLSGSRLELQLAAGARVTVVASTFGAEVLFGPYEIEVATVEEAPPPPPAPDAPVVPIGLPGQSIHLDGSLGDGDPTFDRPAVDCAAAAPNTLPSEPVVFERVQVVNETGADQRLRAVARYLDGGDGVLQVFGEDFDPTSPAGCRAGNDDLDGRADESGVDGVEIGAGEVLTVVVSARGTPPGAWLLEIETLAPPAEDAPIVPIGDVGIAVTLDGDLTGAPTWDRVGQTCATTALGGQSHRVHRIVNTSGGHQHLRITASWDGDGFLALFTDDFVAGDPSASCVAADDDWTANGLPGSAVLGSRIDGVRIEAGEVLVVVASAFSAGASLSSYDIEVLTVEHGGDPTVLEMATDLGTHETGGVIGAGSELLVEESGQSRLYRAHLMRNHGDHEHGLSLTATWAPGEDGVLRVYRYDGAAPGGLGELMAENDDFEGTAQSHISGEELRILDDAPFVVVATGFRGEDAIGAYRLSVTTTE